jgi:protein-L-isoaspartate(D-aspartate) O-methyltransferase
MAGQSEKDTFTAERAKMLRGIEAQVHKLGTGDGGLTLDPKVLAAIRAVPREHFVLVEEKAAAYANHPMPIGHGQTISQPLIVALMTHHLKLGSQHSVLEIGTGSGYQTAVLAEIASDITTIETVNPLAEQAKAVLESLGYRGIRFIEGDGRLGSPAHAPFDRIIVTAAAETLPEALVDQLTPDGRLVAPVGPAGRQEMVLVLKSPDCGIRSKVLFPCAFVPLT